MQERAPGRAKNFGVDDAKGALVGEVVKNSPASKAGFIAGDVIVAMDGKSIDSPTSLRNRVAGLAGGKEGTIRLTRDQKPAELKVKIAEQPVDMEQADAGDSGGQAGGNPALAGVEGEARPPGTRGPPGTPG